MVSQVDPVDLIDRLGCSDIRGSLHTSNARVARQRAWSLVLVIEDAFETMRRSGTSPEARTSLRVIDTVIDDFGKGGTRGRLPGAAGSRPRSTSPG